MASLPPSTPVVWAPDEMDWNAHELSDAFNSYNCVMFQDGIRSGYVIVGDGVKLFIPMRFFFDLDEEALVVMVLNGISVSRRYRHAIGY